MSRRRGVLTEDLDYVLLAAACLQYGLHAPGYGTNGLLRCADGHAVIISSEGVGSTKITPGMVYLDTEFHEWECLPLEVVESCRTGESTDLADLIRTFGSRLDVNHWEWWQQATVNEEESER